MANEYNKPTTEKAFLEKERERQKVIDEVLELGRLLEEKYPHRVPEAMEKLLKLDKEADRRREIAKKLGTSKEVLPN